MNFFKAEYIRLSTTSKEVAWLAKLTRDIGLQITRLTSIYYKNNNNIYMAMNLDINSMTKYINIHHHFRQEKN